VKETNKSIKVKNMQYHIKDMVIPSTINKILELILIQEWMKSKSIHNNIKMDEVITTISIIIKIEIKLMIF